MTALCLASCNSMFKVKGISTLQGEKEAYKDFHN